MKAKQFCAILTVCLLFLATTATQAQSFARFYQLGSYDRYSAVGIKPNGNIVCSGISFINSNHESIITEYTPSGLLVRTWNSIGDPDLFRANNDMYITADGGYVIAGKLRRVGNPWTLFSLTRFDTQGNILWKQTYDTIAPNIVPTEAHSVIQTADNGFFAAGNSFPQNSLVGIRTDANGDVLWTYVTDTLDITNAYDVIETNDSGFLLTGTRYLGNSEWGLFALKLDGNGNRQWVNYYDDPNNRLITPADSTGLTVVQAPTGEFLIGASVFLVGPSLTSTYLLKLNENGDSLTQKILVGNASSLKFGDIILTPDSSYVMAGVEKYITDSAFSIMKLNRNLDTIWAQRITFGAQHGTGVSGLAQTLDGGFAFVRHMPFRAYLMKTDANGNVIRSWLTGKVISDYDSDCAADTNDIYLPGHLVEIIASDNYYGYTDNQGYYSIATFDTGQVTVNYIPTRHYWDTSSCQGSTFTLNLPINDTLDLDIYTEPTFLCPELEVSIHASRLRRCFTNSYYINYCNNGTLPANNAYLEIELDQYLLVDSASIPWVSNTGNLYRFNLDTVGIGQCGSFNLYVTVDCDSTELGQTHCVSAHIYPDSICLPPDPSWDGSSVKVTGECTTGDTLNFTIENTGADMATPSFFLIAEDNVMYASGNFQLLSGETLTRRFKGNGSTFTLVAQQSEGHPGLSFPLVSVEGCGVNNQGTFSKGFVTQYAQDDRDGFIDILCLENIGSYDPNDKRAEPKGLNAEGFITATQPLDYTVRFQNTGTDTAFTVVVRDTLSPNLDITTLRLNSASHTYTFQIIGSNILEWTFPNILLPDSNVNEPLSNGFVSFSISQADGNTPGTEITNRAGIYFDFNAVVLTNTTLNTVITDYKTWFTFIQSPESKLSLNIFPNPNNGTFSLQFEPKGNASYEFVVYDLAGAKQFGQTLTGDAPFVMEPELPTGMYIYQLLENGLAVSMGKVVVNR